MVAPGTQHFTKFTTGKEAIAGTSVPTTYEWYGQGSGEVDNDQMQALHRGNRGTRTSLAHATSMGEIAHFTYSPDPDIGFAYDELHKLFGQLDGGNTGAGGAADKTWTIAPSQTGANNQETYTIEVTDDIQEYESAYCQVESFTLAATTDSLLTGSVNWFGQKLVKSTKTATTANQSVRIAGKLFGPKFAASQAGLAGASVVANFLQDFSVTVTTGLRPDFSMDGLTTFGQTVEALDMKAEGTLHVKSTAQAVSQFYDKYLARTVDFLELTTGSSGPALGGSNYKLLMDFAVLYGKVGMIASSDDGINIYEIPFETVIDPTWGNSIGATIVNSLATIT